MPFLINQPPPETGVDARLDAMEARLARLEARLEPGPAPAVPAAAPAPASAPAPEPQALAQPQDRPKTEDDLEYEVGQSWFALAGTVVLTLGAAFLLSLPFTGLPAAVPSLAGYAAVAALFGMAHLWRDSFALVATYLRGSGMVFLLLATLRLFFPEARQVLLPGSPAGAALLTLVVALNFAIALRRRSAWLAGVAAFTGGAAALAVGSAWYLLAALPVLAAVTVGASHRRAWPVLAVAAIPLFDLAYLLWAAGNSLRGGTLHWTTAPAVAPFALLAGAVILAAAAWLQPRDEPEGALAGISALLNCALAYGIFLLHTVVAFPAEVVAAHATASVVFLGLAIAFWVRHRSRAATFFYAMTGYAALSMAILKLATGPEAFVGLSVQSVVVVATAIWFRSRFIVVANFLIYVGIVLGYVVVAERETGISLGLGVVALVSARILGWQQNRLELKTGLMRNAYLVGAFLVFPYALYHLVPVRYVSLAWVGLALGYYSLNLLVQNQKYRWMGHATLLLTTCYLVIAGTSRLEPVYRVLSFLVLGTVLLVVSLVFTRLRKRRKETSGL